MSNDEAIYLDSSAIVKLVVVEDESTALIKYIRHFDRQISCALAKVEVLRSVCGHGAEAELRARLILDQIRLIRVDDDLLEDAATFPPMILRSIDAIHLAAASALEETLGAVVTYDERMLNACKLLGLRIASPGVR